MIKHLTDVRGELAELLKFVCVCARKAFDLADRIRSSTAA